MISRKCLMFIFVFALQFFLFGQNNYNPSPPGTVKLNDSLFMDFTPVTNTMFMEYTNSVDTFWNENGSDSIQRLPLFGLKKPYIDLDKKDQIIILKQGIENPKYSYLPKTSISRDEAERFCKWRTDMVKIHWGSITSNMNEREKYPLKFKYRLPTYKELEKTLDSFGYIKGFKPETDNIPYKAYKQNTKKRKNRKVLFIENNLSEFTLDSIPFGSNWKSVTPKNEASDYIGFRCVCEIIE